MEELRDPPESNHMSSSLGAEGKGGLAQNFEFRAFVCGVWV